MTRGVGGHGPANIMKHMKGMNFPAKKKQLVDHAKNAPGPDTEDVVASLKKLPNHEYHSPAEVMKALGEVEYTD